ncbi:hypothetical protein [Streptomyces sp. NPDC058874]|uniref:hypothetical protein n=1 Tax=unclassified Streptomyces TaxID=2593676 RepID=UPI0036C68611
MPHRWRSGDAHRSAGSIRSPKPAHGCLPRAHGCLAAALDPPLPGGVRAQTTRECWSRLYALPGRGVGLLDGSRRPGLGPNTAERYARMRDQAAGWGWRSSAWPKRRA